MNISEQIILACNKQLPKNELDFNTLKRQFAKDGKQKQQLPTKTELLKAYHKLLKEKRIKPNKNLEKMLIKRAIRTLSGVTIVTSLAKPYPCPGKCVYC